VTPGDNLTAVPTLFGLSNTECAEVTARPSYKSNGYQGHRAEVTIARVGCVFWLVELGSIYFYPDTQCARPLLVWQKGQA